MSFDSRITYKNRPYSVWQIEEKTADENWKSENFSIIEEESLDTGLDTVDNNEFIGNGLETQNQCSYECGTGRSTLIDHNPLLIEQEKDIIDLAQIEIHKFLLPSYHKSANVVSTNFHSSFIPYCDNFSSSFHKKCKYLHGAPTYGVCVDNLYTQLLRNSVLFEKHFYANNLYEIYAQNSVMNPISYRYDACGIAEKILSEIEAKKKATNSIDFLAAEEYELDGIRRREAVNNTCKTYNVGAFENCRNESQEISCNSMDTGDNKMREQSNVLHNSASYGDTNNNNSRASYYFSNAGEDINVGEIVRRREGVSIRNRDYMNIGDSNISSAEINVSRQTSGDSGERSSAAFFPGSATNVLEVEEKHGRGGSRSIGGRMAMRLGSYVRGFSIGQFGRHLPRRTSHNTTNSEDSFSDLPIPLPYPASQRRADLEEDLHLSTVESANTRERGAAPASAPRYNTRGLETVSSDEGNLNRRKQEECDEDNSYDFEVTRNNYEDIFNRGSFEDCDFTLPDLTHNNVFLF